MESCINHRRFEYYKYEEENGDKRADKFKNNMLSMFGGMKTKHVKILINDVQQRMLMYTRLDLNKSALHRDVDVMLPFYRRDLSYSICMYV